MSRADRGDFERGNDVKETIVAVVAMLVVCAFVYLAVWGYEAFSCHMRWSGFESGTRWGVFSGCQVQVGGRWVPEKNVRSTP